MSEPAATPPPGRLLPLTIGMIAANVVSAALFFGVKLLLDHFHESDARGLAVPSLALVPIVGGLVAAWCWRRLRPTLGDCLIHSLTTTLLGLAGAAIIVREGAVCLVIAAPALYVMILCGTLLGRIWFRPGDTRLRLSVIPLLALLTAGEAVQRTDEMGVVTDEILIHAPPAKVWPHVLAFPEVTEKPDYWIFRLGLPHPTATTNGGDFVGADRQCKFSDGITIKERIAEFVPNEKLTFDIIEQPTHPEAYGHITLHRGRFVLRDNRDGTTTLIGTSWYTLHVRPLWYFDLWTSDMTRAVHLRVMRHIRQLAEG